MRQVEAHLDIDLVVQRWPGTNGEVRDLLEDAEIPREQWLDDPDDPEEHPGAACGILIDLTERTLAAHRKALAPLGSEGDHRPKCTICGLREQMGPVTDPWRQQVASRIFFEDLSREIQGDGDSLRASLQIVHGEGLCAVCLTKRFAPEDYYGAAVGELGLNWNKREDDRPLLRFPSMATIASAPLRLYLKEVSGQNKDIAGWLDRIDDLHGSRCLRFTRPRNLLGGLGPIGDNTRLLAHEGTWFYESTYDPDIVWRNHFAHEREQERDPGRHSRIAKLVAEARDAFARVRRVVDGRSASPYYAVIVLDGDELGKWKAGRHPRSPTIGEIAPTATGDLASKRRPVHPALYGELSRRVADLGNDLHKIVDRYLGRLVYHGGDDLLAFLPLATALPCLDEIRRSIQSPEHLGNRVTISAGVAVSHWRDPLSSALEAARQAEKSAKNAGRDRFAIHADKRSGETLEIVLPWTIDTRELGRLEVIHTLGKMLVRGGDDEPALADVKAAYQLREELPAIGHLVLRDAFLQRIDRLVFTGRTETREPRALLRALLPEDPNFTCNAATVVDFLLFLRFLLREEHGIVTADLLGKLPRKEDMP